MWFTLAALAQVQAPRLTSHPEALPEQAGCDRYEGTASGNDPTVRLVVVLCETDPGSAPATPRDSDITGQLQWSSLVSGWNVRDLKGFRSGEVLTLKDVTIVEEKAQPGWRFCMIDRYSLTRSGDALEGDYRSMICDDTAQLALTRMGSVAAPSDAPLAPPPRTQTDATPKGSALCAVTSMAPVSGALALFTLLGTRRSR